MTDETPLRLPAQCRLPATIRCLSHPSAHVRALSTSVLRDILNSTPMQQGSNEMGGGGGEELCGAQYRGLNLGAIDWHADIEKCLMWEVHSRRATGMTLAFLDDAAKELGCTTASTC